MDKGHLSAVLAKSPFKLRVVLLYAEQVADTLILQTQCLMAREMGSSCTPEFVVGPLSRPFPVEAGFHVTDFGRLEGAAGLY